jgi:hypothetical protein
MLKRLVLYPNYATAFLSSNIDDSHDLIINFTAVNPGTILPSEE